MLSYDFNGEQVNEVIEINGELFRVTMVWDDGSFIEVEPLEIAETTEELPLSA